MEIVKHPACTHILAAPEGVAGVDPLPIAALEDDLGAGMFSFWRPSAEELEMHKAGHTLVLGVHAEDHPVVSMAITAEAL